MAKSKDTGLKDVNGMHLHLNDRVVYRYDPAADGKDKAIPVEVFGIVKEYRDDNANLQYVLFEEQNGKSWVIHDEDQQRITVIHGYSPRLNK